MEQKKSMELDVPITTKVSSNPCSWRGVLQTTLCDKVCDLRQVRYFTLKNLFLATVYQEYSGLLNLMGRELFDSYN
jgi:hypothetical protein